MKYINLKNSSKMVLVDDFDYEHLNRWNWYLVKTKHCEYAYGWVRINDKGRTVFMHRLLMNLTPGDGIDTDHRDGHGLNNQRYNLRPCTHSQNMGNKRKQKGCSSIYKGVSRHKPSSKWAAYIHISGKNKHLGYFVSQIAAARAYDTAAVKLFGEFARPNLKRA